MKFPDAEKIMDVIRDCAEQVVMPRWRNLSDDQIWRKENNSVVTEADIESEDFLKKRLLDLFPGSTTVGEEETEHDPSILDRLAGDAPVWVIDPVDGTSNFARGKDRFAMLLALCYRGEIIGGWLAAPALEQFIWGMKGEGAFRGTERLSTTGKSGVPSVLSGSLGARIRRIEGMRENFGEIVNHACCGAEYIDIALGNLDFAHYRRVKPWDHCAGDLVVREAGGYTGELMSGEPYRPVTPPADGILISCSEAAFEGVAGILKPAVAAL